eukprot:3190441-Lingulodinium_polyedra.AAC.1
MQWGLAPGSHLVRALLAPCSRLASALLVSGSCFARMFVCGWLTRCSHFARALLVPCSRVAR